MPLKQLVIWSYLLRKALTTNKKTRGTRVEFIGRCEVFKASRKSLCRISFFEPCVFILFQFEAHSRSYVACDVTLVKSITYKRKKKSKKLNYFYKYFLHTRFINSLSSERKNNPLATILKKYHKETFEIKFKT